MTLQELKNSVRAEKNSKFDNKIKFEITIVSDKHIIEF
jgi:hypothetical protein